MARAAAPAARPLARSLSHGPRLVEPPPLDMAVRADMVVFTLVIAVCIDSLFLDAAPSLTPLAFSANCRHCVEMVADSSWCVG